METLVVVLAAVVLAALISVIACLRRMSALNAEKSAVAEEKAALASENAVLSSRLKSQEETFRALEEQRAEARLQLEEERKKAFESQRKQMEESFRLLSEQNSAGLRRQNAESITELLKPIQEKFGEFDRTMRTNQEKAAAQDATMKQMMDSLMKKSQSVGEEARNLANALAGHSKVQGDFGEMLLVDLLKASGLEEGVHFMTQGVIRDSSGHEIRSDSGAAMIPDVIVYYPDDTELVIDSKLSLTAYMNYVNAESVEERKRWAKEHVASVTRHVDELKTKDYASYIEDGRRKVDYNIMFIPVEGAFRLMLEEAPLLWQRARDAKVLIVSQMNLMIVLNMILLSWKQHDQEKNIQKVYDTASELMSQLRNWLDSFVKVGDMLGKAGDAYSEAKKKLMDSNQSVIRKIDKLEKLKIAPKRSAGKLKAGGRTVAGVESVIPKELADGLDDEPENAEESE